MSLAMDGVVRRGPAFVPTAALPITRPRTVRQMAPAKVGIDGLRRIAPPASSTVMSPRELLQAQYAGTPFVEAVPVLPETTTPEYGADSVIAPAASAAHTLPRQKIAFGLVASALAISVSVTAVSPAQQAIGALSSLVHSAQASSVTRSSAVPAAPSPDVAAKAAAAQAAAAVTQQSAGLQQLVSDFAGAAPGKFGIVVKDLKTGAEASVDGDRGMTSASLYKLFVAQQVFNQVDNGNLVFGRNAGGGSGLNVDECLRVMINISDNTCGRALGTIINWNEQDATLRAEGYTTTTLAQPQQTSAHDVTKLFERLYRGTLNSPASNQRFLDLLKDQRINNRLPAGLPAGTTIAHKTGDLDGYTHDAGIVYGPKTDYAVVIMGAPGTSPAQFADLSNKLWTALQN